MIRRPNPPDEPLPDGGGPDQPTPAPRRRREAAKKRPTIIPPPTPELAQEGGADLALRRKAHEWWLEAARAAGVDLSHFDPDASLESRIAWALSLGLLIATVYTRFSSKNQHSTDDQARAVVLFAARNAMYVAPELISVDEGTTGRRIRRVGLDRLKAILKARRATVMLVYKASRLFRQAGEGFRLINEHVVEEGLRAISVSQGIDTDDRRTWKSQLVLHGLADDMLLDAIADHCREGLIGLFLKGWSVGALPVGYYAEVIADAPKTNLGKPRTRPAVHAKTAEMIVRHAGWLLAGMTVTEGARRWRAEGGPYDPRSTVGRMTNRSYRRLFANIRLTGRWEYGRKRNHWSSKRDGNMPELQQDSEVATFLCEELRILPDATFMALQEKLGPLGQPAQDRRVERTKELHDLLTDVFRCPHCNRRYHAYGEDSRKMICQGIDCPHRVAVDRPRAVAAVVAKLGELLGGDHDLIERVVAATPRLDAKGDEQVVAEIAEVERKAAASKRKIDDWGDLVGSGSDEDRAQTKAKVRAAQAEHAGHQIALGRLRQVAAGRRQVGPDEVRQALAEFVTVLTAAGDGRLGDEAIFRAATVVRSLTGGRVTVLAGPRALRRHPEVRGEFTPALLESLAEKVGVPIAANGPTPAPVSVWLRRPPIDGRAEEARRLVEDEHMSFKEIGKLWGQSSSPAFRAYHRYYEMIGQPAPPSTAKHGSARTKRP
jgi:site-specific DNA recombinase